MPEIRSVHIEKKQNMHGMYICWGMAAGLSWFKLVLMSWLWAGFSWSCAGAKQLAPAQDQLKPAHDQLMTILYQLITSL